MAVFVVCHLLFCLTNQASLTPAGECFVSFDIKEVCSPAFHSAPAVIGMLKGKVCVILCIGIFVHNHPSGDPEASEDDIKLTKKLAEAGEIMGIDVLDHIIIGDKNYLSLKRGGLF